MDQLPFFSIIIPTYNRAHLIIQAIVSVRYQSFTNWELIIVDDGSTDNTTEIIEAIEDSRIRYFKKVNEERSVARNFGVERAKGTYICFLDSDDYFLQNHLSVHYQHISEYSQPIGSFSSGSLKEKNDQSRKDRHLFNNHTPIRNLWIHGCNFNSFSFHRSIFDTYKLDINLVYMEDIDFLLKVFKTYEVIPISTITHTVVEHNERSTHSIYRKNIKEHGIFLILSLDKIIRNHEEYLKLYLNKEEISDKKGKIILNFLKACIKKINPLCAIFFVIQYFQWRESNK